MKDVVIRISIIRRDPPDFERIRTMMVDAEATLRAGIEAMPGLLAFYAGADEATSSLTNTSFWTSLEHARQLDRYQPMLDLGKVFVAAGARFDRPITNHASLWALGPQAPGVTTG